MKPKIWLYSICYNEAQMLPYTLRHYASWVDKFVIWVDPATNDRTVEILKSFPFVEARTWPHSTGLDDQEFINTVNHWPSQEGRKAGADWVGFVDADELLYHPQPLELLQSFSGDIVRSKGFALISPTGWPIDDGRQLYEQVPTGVIQENYNKYILWRPGFDIHHHHGRHDKPTFTGRFHHPHEAFHMRLLHCHHVGGAEDTKIRNSRNYRRAKDKKFAWAYNADSEAKGFGGTIKWVKEAIDQKKLFNVMEAPL